MGSGSIEISEHRQSFQIAPCGKNHLHIASFRFFENLRSGRPKQHPVFGLVHCGERRRVACVDQIEARVKHTRGAFKRWWTPARPWHQLIKVRFPAKTVADSLKAFPVMQSRARIDAVRGVGNT